MGDLHGGPAGAAEQAVERLADRLAPDIVQCDVDGAFCVVMSDQDPAHRQRRCADVQRIAADQRGLQDAIDDGDDGLLGLAGPAPMVAAQIGQRRRLAISFDPLVSVDAHQDKAAESTWRLAQRKFRLSGKRKGMASIPLIFMTSPRMPRRPRLGSSRPAPRGAAPRPDPSRASQYRRGRSRPPSAARSC